MLTQPGAPTIRQMMMPRDTNAHGTIFGGHILSLIDQAGAVAALEVGARKVVTVAIREVEFKAPVRVGDLVSCYASVVRRGLTSVTVAVRVTADNHARARFGVEVTTAELVFVHVDDDGRPLPLPRPPQV
ncbi:MAG: hotdog domain-containing protein [Nannocystaceae bacterium]